jgi:hypothetical protein
MYEEDIPILFEINNMIGDANFGLEYCLIGKRNPDVLKEVPELLNHGIYFCKKLKEAYGIEEIRTEEDLQTYYFFDSVSSNLPKEFVEEVISNIDSTIEFLTNLRDGGEATEKEIREYQKLFINLESSYMTDLLRLMKHGS